MISILLIGLDNAGKSTLVAHSKSLPTDTFHQIYPTHGFSVQQITLPRGTRAIIYDCSGASRYRNMWDHFVDEVQGIIYVIDSTDTARMDTAKENIHEFLKHPLVKRKPVVFLCNKQDHGQAVAKQDIKRVLGLDKRKISNPLSVKPAVAIQGSGLNDALSFIETHQPGKVEIRIK